MQVPAADLFRHVERLYGRNLDILLEKSGDYNPADDAFRTFYLCEHLGVCKAETAILVVILIKIARLSNLMTSGREPTFETVRETASDIQNYLGKLDYLFSLK